MTTALSEAPTIPTDAPEGILLRLPSNRGYRVATPNGNIVGDRFGDWENVQGRYPDQAAAVSDYQNTFSAVVVERPVAEPAVTPVGQATPAPEAADPFNGAPEGVRIRMPNTGALRVIDGTGIVWGMYGDWSRRFSAEFSTQREAVAHYTDNYGAEVVTEDRPGTSQAASAVETADTSQRVAARVAFTSIDGTVLPEEWFQGGNGLDWSGPGIYARRRDGQPIPTYAHMDELNEQGDYDDYDEREECHQQSPYHDSNGTLGVDFWWCSLNPGHNGPHVALSDEYILAEFGRTPDDVQPAAPASPVVAFTDSRGNVLPEAWFENSPNGLDWSVAGDSTRNAPEWGNELQLNSSNCDEQAPEGLGGGGHQWYCCFHDDGHHIATAGGRVLAEWGRQAAPVAASLPTATPSGSTPEPQRVAFTDSHGNVLPERFFSGSLNGLDWSGDTENRSGDNRSYEFPQWGNELAHVRYDDRCESRSPAGLGGDRWTCTLANRHDGHHIATSDEWVLGEWGRVAPSPASSATQTPSGSFVPGPNHLKKSDVARVMHAYAMSHRGDNGPAALQKGMASLGIDLSDLGSQTYAAVVTIQVPVTITHTQPLEDLDSYAVQDALPTERIRDAVGRFVQAAKIEGENFAGSQVHTERITVTAGSIRRSS